MTATAQATAAFPRWQRLPEGNRLLGILSVSVVLLVGLAIFEDFLQSSRQGGAFYFSESLLFKSVWFIFLPILLLLERHLRTGRGDRVAAKARLVGIATLVHLALVPPTIWLLSALFLDHRYGVVKVFTYTASNDLVAILLVYTAFVSLARRPDAAAAATTAPPQPAFLVVSSGRKSHRIALEQILAVRSATPYVAIDTGQRQFLHLATMAEIGRDLGPRFMRIHRSIHVNLDKVVSYTSRLNGDYDLTLVDGSEVRLSRNYAAAFKARLCASPRLKP